MRTWAEHPGPGRLEVEAPRLISLPPTPFGRRAPVGSRGCSRRLRAVSRGSRISRWRHRCPRAYPKGRRLLPRGRRGIGVDSEVEGLRPPLGRRKGRGDEGGQGEARGGSGTRVRSKTPCPLRCRWSCIHSWSRCPSGQAPSLPRRRYPLSADVWLCVARSMSVLMICPTVNPESKDAR